MFALQARNITKIVNFLIHINIYPISENTPVNRQLICNNIALSSGNKTRFAKSGTCITSTLICLKTFKYFSDCGVNIGFWKRFTKDSLVTVQGINMSIDINILREIASRYG